MSNHILRKLSLRFRYSFQGLKVIVTSPHEFLLHLIAAGVAITLGIVLKIESTEWLFIGLAIFIVFILELINSSIERLADRVSKDYHELIKKSKDMASAAVLLGSILAIFIAGIIFVPKII